MALYGSYDGWKLASPWEDATWYADLPTILIAACDTPEDCTHPSIAPGHGHALADLRCANPDCAERGHVVCEGDDLLPGEVECRECGLDYAVRREEA